MTDTVREPSLTVNDLTDPALRALLFSQLIKCGKYLLTSNDMGAFNSICMQAFELRRKFGADLVAIVRDWLESRVKR